MKTKNMSVFAIESQSEDESTRDRSVLHTHLDICSYVVHISWHFLTIIEWLSFSSSAALRFSAYNIFSKRKLECDFFWPHVIDYILLMARKLYLIRLQETEEI